MRGKLKKYNIGNNDYPILLRVSKSLGICQNEISRLTNLNKSLFSKEIKKLKKSIYNKKMIYIINKNKSIFN